MDQELKQRLIGAAVITALAAIFVPMLFDDPIDESGKSINELTIPKLPNKAQDVEIMPLPEKVEDVATETPMEKPAQPPSAPTPYQSEEDAETGSGGYSRPPRLARDAEETTRPRSPEPEMDAVDEADFLPPAPAVEAPVQTKVSPEVSAKPAVEPVRKPSQAALDSGTVRWYLNAGSFSHKDNAVSMMDNLRKHGFSVSMKEVASDKGIIYKVRVGPMLDRAKAQEVKDKLSKINVNSFVAGED